MTNLLIKKIKEHIAEFNKQVHRSNTGHGFMTDADYTISRTYDGIMEIIENHETLENANKYDQN